MDLKFEIFGRVQGVGFRPFIYSLALRYGVKGEVFNDSEGVKIFASATSEILENFKDAILGELPPLAKIEKMRISEISGLNFSEFKITNSQKTQNFTPILPDFAICDDCKREFYDPQNFRYHYAFINCTNCGPRLSIIKKLPYDRENTTMSVFKMCKNCNAEYVDPLNRRYHAEPISCPKCGPELFLKNIRGEILESGENAVKMVAELLQNGEIVAVKGMGGFHIMVNACDFSAVQKLRVRKNRPTKPFAIMCKDAQMAEKIAEISPFESEILNSNIKPIVILKMKNSALQSNEMVENSSLRNFTEAEIIQSKNSQNSENFKNFTNNSENFINLAPNIVPNLDKIGIFLPNTGLHLLIFEYIKFPIVATSANISGEPIIFSGEILREKLANVVDFYLDNNREILTPSDDSITQIIDFVDILKENNNKNGEISTNKSGENLQILEIKKNSQSAKITQKTQFLRTSRGLNPKIFFSDFRIKGTFLALGSELKNEFAIYKDGLVLVSPYIGDLKNVATSERFFELLHIFKTAYELEFEGIIADLHPNFLHTKHFEQSHKITRFQHHFSHLVSALAENSRLRSGKKFLGFSFDGTGFGEDGTIWGGEVMIFDEFGFKRVLHFENFALIGGENAIKNIYKLTISMIFKFGIENDSDVAKFLAQFDKTEIKNLKILEKKSIKTSSLGRIFDAFACVICSLNKITYDGEAGMNLEKLYIKNYTKFYTFSIKNGEILFHDAFLQIFKDDPREAASKFINGIAVLIAQISLNIRFFGENFSMQNENFDFFDDKNVDFASLQDFTKAINSENLEVVLSGGVFQNKTLLNKIAEIFSKIGQKYYINLNEPTNDSGIAYGQLMAFLSQKEREN